jgi:hypothetical protein
MKTFSLIVLLIFGIPCLTLLYLIDLSLVLKEALVVLIFLSFFCFSFLSGRPNYCSLFIVHSFRMLHFPVPHFDGKNNEQTYKFTYIVNVEKLYRFIGNYDATVK